MTTDRGVLVGATISWILTAALVIRVFAIGKPGVVVILAPAIVGAIVALATHRRSWLFGSSALTAATAVPLLIGGVGLVYLPSAVLFLVAAARRWA